MTEQQEQLVLAMLEEFSDVQLAEINGTRYCLFCGGLQFFWNVDVLHGNNCIIQLAKQLKETLQQ